MVKLVKQNQAEKEAAEKKKKQRRLLAAVVAAAVCMTLLMMFVVLPGRRAQGNTDANVDGNTQGASEDASTSSLDPSLTYYADIVIVDYGNITIQLEPDSAPASVENFVQLAQEGFYDGLTFHRIISGFMMQGGDPDGNGTGGSAQTIPGEFTANGYDNTLSHTRGAVSMARSNVSYDSASSQFFIVHEDSTFLDGQYAVFGYVTEGMDVVDAVCEAAVPTDNNGSIAAEEQPVIEQITIRTE